MPSLRLLVKESTPEQDFACCLYICLGVADSLGGSLLPLTQEPPALHSADAPLKEAALPAFIH